MASNNNFENLKMWSTVNFENLKMWSTVNVIKILDYGYLI